MTVVPSMCPLYSPRSQRRILEVPRRFHLVEARTRMLYHYPVLPCVPITIPRVHGPICVRISTSCAAYRMAVPAASGPICVTVIGSRVGHSLRDSPLVLRLVRACIFVPAVVAPWSVAITIIGAVYSAHFDIGDCLLVARCGKEVNEECEDVEGEDKGDDPFEDCANVLFFVEGADDKDDGHGDWGVLVLIFDDMMDREGNFEGMRTFDEDEEKLHPEGGPQDTVLAEMHTEALVLGADEDSAYDISGAVRAF